MVEMYEWYEFSGKVVGWSGGGVEAVGGGFSLM
jgi:hypothetical protein